MYSHRSGHGSRGPKAYPVLLPVTAAHARLHVLEWSETMAGETQIGITTKRRRTPTRVAVTKKTGATKRWQRCANYRLTAVLLPVTAISPSEGF